MKPHLATLFLLLMHFSIYSQEQRLRDYGIALGVLRPGPLNAITDVPGVKVGHTTLIRGDSVRSGVTAILPHSGNLFQEKLPAAIYLGNGFGKLAGYSQVEELGNLETPIVLTNTLSVPTAMDAVISYTLSQSGNEEVRSVNAVVGETNDGWLNDIRGRHVTENDVLKAIEAAKGGGVAEGNVGAGTGTVAFNFKGGVGTSSRVLPAKYGDYVVGVLVQTNFGGVLTLNGKNLSKAMDMVPIRYEDTDGSCMMVVFTNAPLDSRNLKRLAKRCMLGLARTGGFASNGSGDYAIAVSTATVNREAYQPVDITRQTETVNNDMMSPLFLATVEATEEAIWNSLFMAESMTGYQGHSVQALPVEKILELVKQ
jgi:D-aminopeptidase